MRASLLRFLLLLLLHLLPCFIAMLAFSCQGVAAINRKSAYPDQTLTRRRQNQLVSRGHPLHHHHHWPLTDEQKADQNLQFMLSLYQSAAEPDGRPKQHRKFGSNTVRLLRPSASTVHYLPASKDHHYSFTVHYNLDTLPSEQLVRASFVHLRASPSSSASWSPSEAQEAPRCWGQIASLGQDHLVTLEPHEQWTETDITEHIQQGRKRTEAGHLTLTALYWCTEPGYAEDDGGITYWWRRLQGKAQRRGEPHVEVPSLLLYLEEEREAKAWMGDLLGSEGVNLLRQISHWHPLARRRRSKDSSSELEDPFLDALKNAPKSPLSSSSSSYSVSTGPVTSVVPKFPGLNVKTGVPKNRCKLHSLTLSFRELGLGHYFIAPPVYNPRFCQGNCPKILHYGYHSPNHAIIQTLINDLGVGDVPLPSCVPYKYMPMSVLVKHKMNVEYKELDNMVAESCTCR